MKKLIITTAIVLGMSMTTFAGPNQGGGLFQRGAGSDEMDYMNRTGEMPMLPNHGETTNQDSNGPVGSGIAVLALLGGAYLIGKKHRKE